MKAAEDQGVTVLAEVEERKARMLATAMSRRRVRASFVAQAMWGVM